MSKSHLQGKFNWQQIAKDFKLDLASTNFICHLPLNLHALIAKFR
ncbi:hypothetical protein [Campylobacter concisus]|nr:hypothetical protein [Campylobacter concisus]